MKFLIFVFSLTIGIATNAQHKLVKKWESDSLFKVPESVFFDKDHNLLYVTNIEGKDPWAKDGLGSIGKMDVNGRIIDAEWITGFNSPKGMGIYIHTLYVADMDKVVVVDVRKGKIAYAIDVPGALGLNDITIDDVGVVYVSDSKGKKVYRIEKGIASVYLENLQGPNGLLLHDDRLYVLDQGGLYKVNEDKSLALIVDGMEGGVDGIEHVTRKEFIVSTWGGVVYYVNATTKTKEILLDGRAAKINSADIAFDAATGTVFIPTFWKNTVVAYEVK